MERVLFSCGAFYQSVWLFVMDSTRSAGSRPDTGFFLIVVVAGVTKAMAQITPRYQVSSTNAAVTWVNTTICKYSVYSTVGRYLDHGMG